MSSSPDEIAALAAHLGDVATLDRHIKIERLDAAPALWRQSSSVDFAPVAHLNAEIEQYLWPGLPAARIDKVDRERIYAGFGSTKDICRIYI